MFRANGRSDYFLDVSPSEDVQKLHDSSLPNSYPLAICYHLHIQLQVIKLQTNSFADYVTKQSKTPRSRVLLENLTVTQPVSKFPAVHETQMFITVFITSCCPYSESDKSRPCPTHISLKSILILSSHLSLGLPSGLFLARSPTKTRYATLRTAFQPHARWDHYKVKRQLKRKQNATN